ncbi:ArsA-related P-loop ATPase [Nocardia sp. NPDC050406]|uniref:ArsA family ATPase n=1 Tax=Nocardia sp. NPDC050406 TaxID=3364318 RepID=UPI0037B1BFE3
MELFVGKGGVGKTTLACATAQAYARAGQRVLLASLDQAHSLGDALGFRFAHDPGTVPGVVTVAPGLDVIEVDSLALLEDRFREVVRMLSGAGHDHGIDLAALDPAELTGLPGVQELLALLEITQFAEDDDWDVIVLDCPPSADMLRLITAPDTLLGYLERVWPAHSRTLSAIGPDLRRVVLATTVDRIVSAVAGIRDLFADRTRTGARLVTAPERVAVAESARVRSAAALLGLRLDAVLVNKVLPPMPAPEVLGAPNPAGPPTRDTAATSNPGGFPTRDVDGAPNPVGFPTRDAGGTPTQAGLLTRDVPGRPTQVGYPAPHVDPGSVGNSAARDDRAPSGPAVASAARPSESFTPTTPSASSGASEGGWRPMGAAPLPSGAPASTGGAPMHPAVRWYFDRRGEQMAVVAELRRRMAPTPVVVVGHVGPEPVGLAALSGLSVGVDASGEWVGTEPVPMLGSEAAGVPVVTGEPMVRLESGAGVHSVYALRMHLPVVDASTLRLGRVEDDLIVGADGVRRRLRLAPVLRRCTVDGAELDGEHLIVRFRPDPQVWPK